MAESKEQQAFVVESDEGQDTGYIDEKRAKQSCSNERRAKEDIELKRMAWPAETAAAYSGSLLSKVSWEWDEYDDIQRKVTAKAIMNDKDPLLLAVKVTEKLHERAAKEEPNKDDFIELANRVEEFTLRFLDPLTDQKQWREAFALNPGTDVLLDTAIKLNQKKFFDHPIVISIMDEKWHGNRQIAFIPSNLWWLFLNLWCIVDIVLFPLSFSIFLVLGCVATRVEWLRSIFRRRLFYLRDEEFKATSLYQRYKEFFILPYFIFVRDTLSYLALLGLHLALCVEPSQLEFSVLEWTILVFLFGRLLVEIKQVGHLMRGKARKIKLLGNYFRDLWNLFDVTSLVIFFCAILPLRIFTWVEWGTVRHNRTLDIAAILYGVNTMLFTFRVFGSILEAFERVGTIQIALFCIIKDAVVVVLHFAFITLAFSSTITKIFVAESTMAGNTVKHSWWEIISQLGLSLLELSDGLSFFQSTDTLSRALIHLLYALFLVMALILLINMLIALLSNTYQQVQTNSRQEWAFRKAVTIQTYSNYHPIPVPLNIISTVALWFCGKKPRADETEARNKDLNLLSVVLELKHKYRLNYGDLFPPLDKLDHVLDDTGNTESMVKQLLYRTFTTQQGCNKALLPTGPKAWDISRHILVEGYLVTAIKEGSAKYLAPFSPRFPHFEVMIMEGGTTKWFALGVVFKDYTYWLPGRGGGTVGYNTGEKTIWSSNAEGTLSKNATKGPAACRRGDVVRCTVVFEEKEEIDEQLYKVPVVFTVNGSRVVPEAHDSCIEYTPDTSLYPQIGFYYENSVLAKMCPREDLDYQDVQIQELRSDVLKVKTELTGLSKSLLRTKESMARHDENSDVADIREDLSLHEMKLELSEIRSELSHVRVSLDAVLARLAKTED